MAVVGFAAVGLASVMAGCGGAAGASVGAPSPPPVVISGIEWRATSVAGVTPPAQHVPTITFEEGRASGSTGCNEYGADALVDGASITVSGIVQTEMACIDDGVMELEAAFASALAKAQSIAVVDGRLVLSGPGGDLVFTRAG